MDIKFGPMPVFGAHVVGWEFGQKPTVQDIDNLRNGLSQYKMLLLPKKILEAQELKDLTYVFGTRLFTPGRLFWHSPEHKEVVKATNQLLQEVGSCGCESWHCDGHYMRDPCAITVMNMVQAAEGGAISVVDLQAVYARLPGGARQALSKLRCVNERSRVTQPLVIRHPLTGRLGLYINMYARTIDAAGRKVPQVDAFLNEILVHSAYKHHWESGDIMIIDNFAVCHRVCPADPSQKEVFQRAQTHLSGTWWTPIRHAPARCNAAQTDGSRQPALL